MLLKGERCLRSLITPDILNYPKTLSHAYIDERLALFLATKFEQSSAEAFRKPFYSVRVRQCLHSHSFYVTSIGDGTFLYAQVSKVCLTQKMSVRST